jgi:hypothetical protein
MNNNLPIIGQVYDYFDNGLLMESRRYKVIITDIVPFDKIEKNIREAWEEDLRILPNVFSKTTDYFIKAVIFPDGSHIEIVFVRANEERVYKWFSLGFWGGILDVDGSLLEKNTEI